MTRKRFFMEQELGEQEETVRITGSAFHHMKNVLRVRPGEEVDLRDGKGGRWLGVVREMDEKTIGLDLESIPPPLVESPLRLTLALAYGRADRMELVVRQATELGAHRMVFFRARRSQYGLSGEAERKKKERWTRIAREALRQCGRTMVPEVAFAKDVEELLKAVLCWENERGNVIRIMAVEGERSGDLLQVWRKAPDGGGMVVAVGPEGGWTEDEVQGFRRAGFFSVGLGPRVLRLETAAAALTASVQLLWGDLSLGEGERKATES